MGCGVRRGTWAPPYSRVFCRAVPACPAVGAGKNRSGRCRHRPLRSFHFTVVGADDSVCPGPITQHLVGQGPCALPWVQYKTVGPMWASAPTDALQEVQWAGDRKGRPYESVTRGAGESGIPQSRLRRASPL